MKYRALISFFRNGNPVDINLSINAKDDNDANDFLHQVIEAEKIEKDDISALELYQLIWEDEEVKERIRKLLEEFKKKP